MTPHYKRTRVTSEVVLSLSQAVCSVRHACPGHTDTRIGRAQLKKLVARRNVAHSLQLGFTRV